MHRLKRVSVPEADMAISSTTTCRQETILVRRPADSLHCSCVLVEFHDWFIRVKVPNHELVVIATRSELLVVKRPLQPANFLLMACHLLEVLTWSTKISLQDVAVATASANYRLVPGNGADSTNVTI